VGHAIQCRYTQKESGRLLCEVSRMQLRARERIGAKEARFDETPSTLARLLLPVGVTQVANRPQFLISLPGFPCTIPMLPHLRILSRWNRNRGSGRFQRFMADAVCTTFLYSSKSLGPCLFV
jgi:hypothetical protein